MILLLYILCLVNILQFGVAQQQFCRDKVCDNGECVQKHNWCDGKVHCKDGSDETKCETQRCNPNSQFRCNYGACIDNNLKCDGKNDCKDGSDESAFECFTLNMHGNCSDFELQCQNLQCIPQENACDTKLDCADGSDETKKTCERQQCPHYSFKCAYGACIPMKKKCDKNIDCIDGSDEEYCYDDRIGVFNSSLPILIHRNNDQITPINTNYYSNKIGDTDCFVPKDDSLALIEDEKNLQLRPGTNASRETSVTYLCLKNTFLVGTATTNFCLVDAWANEHPSCLKRCPPINHFTIKPVCELNGVGVPCNEPVKIGTTAKINCEVMYEKPDRQVNEDIQCQDDGNWDFDPFKCQQTCGIIDTKVAFSVNSKVTQVHSVPWNVGIYQKNRMDGRWGHICGGTLIRSKIIISAAHCFWDKSVGKVSDKSNYIITVGKFYRDFYANESEVIQKKTISKIDIPPSFNDANYDFANDFAVLTLDDHIQFNSYVRPACLTRKEGNEQYVTSGNLGIVAGWGVTDGGELSPELRSVELETIDYDTCTKRKLKPTETISNDKFCVETSAGKNVCQGDSGGGFVVPESINNVQYYHLWGLVSSGIIPKGGTIICNSNFTTSFTNIQFYWYLVNDAIKIGYKTTTK